VLFPEFAQPRSIARNEHSSRLNHGRRHRFREVVGPIKRVGRIPANCCQQSTPSSARALRRQTCWPRHSSSTRSRSPDRSKISHDPLGNAGQARVLTGRDATVWSAPALEQIVAEVLRSGFKVGIHCLSGLFRYFELHGMFGLRWRTQARSAVTPRGATSSTLTRTTSHPLSLLSIARLNIAKSCFCHPSGAWCGSGP